jgi:hypothetical protein
VLGWVKLGTAALYLAGNTSASLRASVICLSCSEVDAMAGDTHANICYDLTSASRLLCPVASLILSYQYLGVLVFQNLV